jgi:hypothetical protein
LAWFAVEGVIGEQVVHAVGSDGQLSCDRLLASRARLLVGLGAEFCCQDPPRRFLASLLATSPPRHPRHASCPWPPPPLVAILAMAAAAAVLAQRQVGGAHEGSPAFAPLMAGLDLRPPAKGHSMLAKGRTRPASRGRVSPGPTRQAKGPGRDAPGPRVG